MKIRKTFRKMYSSERKHQKSEQSKIDLKINIPSSTVCNCFQHFVSLWSISLIKGYFSYEFSRGKYHKMHKLKYTC